MADWREQNPVGSIIEPFTGASPSKIADAVQVFAQDGAKHVSYSSISALQTSSDDTNRIVLDDDNIPIITINKRLFKTVIIFVMVFVKEASKVLFSIILYGAGVDP